MSVNGMIATPEFRDCGKHRGDIGHLPNLVTQHAPDRGQYGRYRHNDADHDVVIDVPSVALPLRDQHEPQVLTGDLDLSEIVGVLICDRIRLREYFAPVHPAVPQPLRRNRGCNHKFREPSFAAQADGYRNDYAAAHFALRFVSNSVFKLSAPGPGKGSAEFASM